MFRSISFSVLYQSYVDFCPSSIPAKFRISIMLRLSVSIGLLVDNFYLRISIDEMIELNDRIDQNIKNFMKTLPSEDIYFEAVREIIKDILKEYIKKRINEDPDLKSGIAEVLKEFIAAKLKEYDSMARMARITAKIGVQIAPESIKDEAMEDFVSVFQKEIEEIIKKTL